MSSRHIWHQQIEAQLDAALRQSARADEVAAAVARLRGTARTADGAVQVDVDHRGFVTDVRLTERAKEHGVEEMSHLVTTTAQEAVADVRRQAAHLQETLVGPPVDLFDTTVLDAYEDILRGTPTEGAR
jgi:DNA-binding protein YbaB